MPWFAFGCAGVVLFNSLRLLPTSVVAVTTEIDTIQLAMAMAALGLSTHLGASRNAGVKPPAARGHSVRLLVIGGQLMNRWVPALLA